MSYGRIQLVWLQSFALSSTGSCPVGSGKPEDLIDLALVRRSQGCFLGEIVPELCFERAAMAGWKRSDFRQGEEFVQRPGEFKPAFSSGPRFVVLAGFSQVFSSQPLPDLYLYPVSYSTRSSSLT